MTLTRRDLVWAVLVALALCSSGLLAQQRTAPGQYTVFPPGGQSCGSWTAAQKETAIDTVAKVAWTLGFVSGYGYSPAPPMRDTDSAAIRAYMDNYCASHPLDTIAGGAQALVRELAK